MVLARNIPDSGWAWVVLVVVFLIQILSSVVVYSVGILKLAFLDKYGEDPVKTDWLGSLQVSLSQMAGPFVSLALSRYHCRTVIFISGIVTAIGFLWSAFVDKMDLLFLSYAAIGGIGKGFGFGASMVSLGYYFKKRLYFASGIATTGAGVGLMIFPPLIQMLITNYGLASTLMIISGAILQFCVLGALIAPNRQEITAKHIKELRDEPSDGPKLNTNILRNYSFDVYLLSVFFWNLAYAFISQSLPLYSSYTGNSRDEAAFLLSLSGFSSMIGRLLGGIAANDEQIDGIILFFGPNGVFALSSLLFPLYGKSYSGQVFYAVTYGLYTGSSTSVQGPIVARLLGVEMLATGFGLLMLVTGIGSLIGPPFGGWLMVVAPFLEVGFFVAGVAFLLSCLTGMMIIVLEKRKLDEIVQTPAKTRSGSLSISHYGASIHTLNDLTLEVTREPSGRFRTETTISGRYRSETCTSETSSFL